MTIMARDNKNDICYSDATSTKGSDIQQNNDQESPTKETKLSQAVYSYETKGDEAGDNEGCEITKDQLEAEVTVDVPLGENEDDFGDFDTAFATSNRNNDNDCVLPPKDEFVNPIESTNFSCQGTNIVREIDPFSDESDDDFGDFGEVVAAPIRPNLGREEDNSAQTSMLSSNNTPKSSTTDAICNSVRKKVQLIWYQSASGRVRGVGDSKI